MRKLFARWFFAFAAFNIAIAAILDEAETSALLVWLYKDLIDSAKATVARSDQK